MKRLLRVLIPNRAWQGCRAIWNRRRVRHVEEICMAKMTASGRGSDLTTENRLGLIGSSSKLRRLMVIADVMWEADELVPDLRRICDVILHDIRPAIHGAAQDDRAQRAFHDIRRFVLEARHEPPDAILLYLRGSLLSEQLFDLLRKQWGCPIIGWNLDDKTTFWDYGSHGGGDHHRRWAKLFDVNLTNSKIASTWYNEAGANCLYMPPAMRTPIGFTEPDIGAFDHGISFVGSPKIDRETLIGDLNEAGLKVSVFGKGWPGGGWVADPVAIYRTSQINLGLGMATPRLATMKNRDFECPGVGACYLTTYNWELAEWWDIGKEILCYRSLEELVEMACWYRNRPDACLSIAKAAWHRGNAEHTWEIRFRAIFRQMGFSI